MKRERKIGGGGGGRGTENLKQLGYLSIYSNTSLVPVVAVGRRSEDGRQPEGGRGGMRWPGSEGVREEERR